MIEIFILGAIQGLTEFLPVSSSGHLVLAKHFLGVKSAGAELEILLHAATCLAVLIYFSRDFTRLFLPKTSAGDFNLKHVLIACFITGAVGYIIKDRVITLFDQPLIAALCLIVMGTLLLLSKCIPNRTQAISMRVAVIFGCVQIIALLPGISRSGITIISLLCLGVDRNSAFRFSFVSSLPLILAASLLQLLEGLNIATLWSMFPGFLSAFIFGYIALMVLEKLLLSNRFHAFGYYCLSIGIVAAIQLISSSTN